MRDNGLQLLSMLKAADFARYMSVLFAPEAHRNALCALHLYTIELARVPQLVREPMAGEIRLQWWQEVLNGQRDGEAEANPISKALLEAIAHYGLPRAALATMAEARIFDLYNDPMPDLKSFEGYCGEIYAVPYQIAVMILANEGANSTSELSGHAGMVSGIAGVLRRLPHDISAQKCAIPREILSASGLDHERLMTLEDPSQMIPAMDALQALGRDHLKRFTAERKALKNQHRSQILNAYLPIIQDEIALQNIKAKTLLKQPFISSQFLLTRKIFARSFLG